MVRDNNYKYCDICIDFVIERKNYNKYESIVNDFINEIQSLGNTERDNLNVSEYWNNHCDYPEVQLEEIPF